MSRAPRLAAWLHRFVTSRKPAESKSPVFRALKRAADGVCIAAADMVLGSGSPRRAIGLARRVVTQGANADTVADSTAFTTSSDAEGPVIRACVLLHAMGRYRSAVEVLLRRFQSGLADDQTRTWLSHFLREIGDVDAAQRIAPDAGHSAGADTSGGAPVPNATAATRLRYGVVVLTMFDSDVFRSSLRSLMASDFEGPVVVVEQGSAQERTCETVCGELGVHYVKNTGGIAGDQGLDLGIERLPPDTEIVIHAHNDVLWPSAWFGQLNAAWERVFDSQKVHMLNLGYLEFVGGEEDPLTKLFTMGRYDDLLWVLRAMRNVSSTMGRVHDVQIDDMNLTFGFARDRWTYWPERLHMMPGRYSVGASFALESWRARGGFDVTMGFGGDTELIHYGLSNRKWGLWINNTPLIHNGSYDTRRMSREDQLAFERLVAEGYRGFKTKYGYETEHFLSTYGEVISLNHDTIIAAVNSGQFDDIGSVFDLFWTRLATKTFDTCEVARCRDRAKCQYARRDQPREPG